MSSETSYVKFLRKTMEVLYGKRIISNLLCEIIEANISPVKSISFRYEMLFTGHSSDLLEITVYMLLPLKIIHCTPFSYASHVVNV